MSYEIYTDGSYNHWNGTGGYGVFCTTLDLCDAGKALGVYSSIRAEYYAVEKALEQVLKFISKSQSPEVIIVTICTDLWAIFRDLHEWNIGLPAPRLE